MLQTIGDGALSPGTSLPKHGSAAATLAASGLNSHNLPHLFSISPIPRSKLLDTLLCSLQSRVDNVLSEPFRAIESSNKAGS